MAPADDHIEEEIKEGEEDIGYDSFLRPIKRRMNNLHQRNSNSNDNLHGSFGPAETGSNYLGFSDNLALDEDVEGRSQKS